MGELECLELNSKLQPQENLEILINEVEAKEEAFIRLRNSYNKLKKDKEKLEEDLAKEKAVLAEFKILHEYKVNQLDLECCDLSKSLCDEKLLQFKQALF